MCVVSMVHDGFEPIIPWVETVPADDWWRGPYVAPKANPIDAAPALDLGALIKEFRELIEAAKRIDEVTKQPDCVDPEKAKLQERVAELEKLLADPPEFVLAKGGQIEPGRYRVIDGKLYRAVE